MSLETGNPPLQPKEAPAVAPRFPTVVRSFPAVKPIAPALKPIDSTAKPRAPTVIPRVPTVVPSFRDPEALIKHFQGEKQRLTELRTTIEQNRQNQEQAFQIIDRHRDVLLKASPVHLYMLENIFPGTLSFLFLEPPSRENNIKKGKIDFKNAGFLESIIGLGDFLNIKASYVRVTDAKGKVYYGCRKDNVAFYKGKRHGFVDLAKKPPFIPLSSGATFEEISQQEYFSKRKPKKGAKYSAHLPDKSAQEIDPKWLKTVSEQEKEMRIILAEDDDVDNGENLKGEALWTHPPFQKAAKEMCARLGMRLNDLKTVLERESGINPKEINEKSKAIGLIQFMPNTAIGLKTSISELRTMSGVKQLYYIEQHFKPYKGRLNSLNNIYTAIFYPASMDKGNGFVLGSEVSDKYAKAVARQNAGMKRKRSSPYITKGDMLAWINKNIGIA